VSGKKTILIKGGYIQDALKQVSDIIVNAQDIKRKSRFWRDRVIGRISPTKVVYHVKL